MISLEQVKLLESKVTKAIDYVKKVTEENTSLKGKLDSYQNRIDELEVLIQQFKEEQNRIADGILSALDRLNQFEDAFEKPIAEENQSSPPAETIPVKDTAGSKKDTSTKKGKEEPALTLEPEPHAEPEPEPGEEPKSSEELDIF